MEIGDENRVGRPLDRTRSLAQRLRRGLLVLRMERQSVSNRAD